MDKDVLSNLRTILGEARAPCFYPAGLVEGLYQVEGRDRVVARSFGAHDQRQCPIGCGRALSMKNIFRYSMEINGDRSGIPVKKSENR